MVKLSYWKEFPGTTVNSWSHKYFESWLTYKEEMVQAVL